MKAYKAFELDKTCRGFQYEEGKSYKIDGKIIPCERGFHACLKLEDTLNYYSTSSLFAEVELGEAILKEGNKLVASEIKIGKFFKLEDWMKDNEERQLAVVRKDGLAIKYIKNPSEEVKLAAMDYLINLTD